MPIQITELNISVSVNQPGSQQAAPSSDPQEQQHAQTNLVSDCVDQVLKVLQDKKER